MTDEEKRNEAYTYLRSCQRMDQKIRRLSLQHDELQAALLPQGIRYDVDRVQTSPQDKLPEVAAMVVDLEKEIEDLQERKAQRLKEIMEIINSLEDEDQKTVLTCFFIGRLPMSDIAVQLHYHRSQVYRIRDDALLAVYGKRCDK